MTSLEKGKWLILLPKDLKYNWHQRGKKNYDNGDYYDDDDYDDDNDDNDDYNVFFHPKGPQTGMAPGGAYDDDDDDKIDDNDNNDYDNEDDDDDNSDGNGVFFFFKTICFCRNFVFEALLW